MKKISAQTHGRYWHTITDVVRVLRNAPPEGMTYLELCAATRYQIRTVRNAVNAAAALGTVVRVGLRRPETARKGGGQALWKLPPAGQP